MQQSPSVRIPLMKSTFYDEVQTRKRLAEFVLQSDRLSMGEECLKYEAAFAAKQERKHAIVVTSGSAANLILIQSLLNLGRLKPGDNVGFSALTWATNPMPLIQLGLVPVPLDCNPRSLNTGTAELEERINGLAAVFITNVLGFCDDLDAVAALCKERGVLLLEDNCESLGSRHAGTLLGNFGLASTFSTFVGHHLSTIEGGMVCTDDDELAEMLVMVRAHGWDRNVSPTKRDQLRTEHGIDDFYARYTFYDLAYNTRPTDITGFLGQLQLPHWDGIVAKRRAHFDRFQEAISAHADRFEPLNVSHMDLVSNFAMPVICRNAGDRAGLLQAFTNAGVEIRPVIAGDTTQHPFYKKYVKTLLPCPNAATVHARGFYFPNHPELTEEDVQLLCGLLE